MTGAQYQARVASVGRGDFKRSGKHRQLRLAVQLTQIETAIGCRSPDCALGAQQVQRTRVCRRGHEDFALQEFDQTLLFIEPHIDRARCIQLHLTAIAQRHFALFANSTAVVGQHRLQGNLLAQTPACHRTRAEQQQEFQCMPAARGFRCAERRMGQRRGQTAQALIDPLHVRPGPLMFSVAVEPRLPGVLASGIQRTLLHFQQPADCLLRDGRRNVGFVQGVVAQAHRAK